VESPDNVVVTPWGDLWFCEDEVVTGNGRNRIVGITPEGRVYRFARNRFNYSEFTGPTFSPDGRTFFVNVQNPDMTLAIWGPFSRPNPIRQRRIAHAAPPARYAPRVSEGLAEAAERYGISRLEAAAYDRIGIPLA
jgi:secreted PhoX family phosphatase